ncbi:MAG: RNA polymerase-binding protein DksA [Pseudomonadota bacterium]
MEFSGIEEVPPYVPKKSEKYMSKRMAEYFKNILLAWKKELIEENDRTVEHMQDEATNIPDPNDRATRETEFSFELRERDRDRKLRDKIDLCLQKIDEGTYGYCDTCGEEIGLPRLQARPTAVLCVDCKNLEEIVEKQRGT